MVNGDMSCKSDFNYKISVTVLDNVMIWLISGQMITINKNWLHSIIHYTIIMYCIRLDKIVFKSIMNIYSEYFQYSIIMVFQKCWSTSLSTSYIYVLNFINENI